MKSSKQILISAKKTIQEQTEYIQNLGNSLNATFHKIVNILSSTNGTIFFIAPAELCNIAQQLSANFRIIGVKAFYLNPANAANGEVAIISQNDIVIIISPTGEEDDIINLIPWLKRGKAGIVLLTISPRSSLARASDTVLPLQGVGKLNSHSFFSFSSAVFILVNLIIICIEEEKKIIIPKTSKHLAPSPKTYKGKGSLLIEDVISIRPQNPIVSKNMIFKDALLEMTSKGLGAITIVDEKGRLIGIMTDGDIRRLLQKTQGVLTKLFLTSVEMVMTKKPAFVKKDTSVIDALVLMENKAITVLPVVNKNEQPVGMVHLHDLVKLGLFAK